MSAIAATHLKRLSNEDTHESLDGMVLAIRARSATLDGRLPCHRLQVQEWRLDVIGAPICLSVSPSPVRWRVENPSCSCSWP